jgi:hypothetical protein
MKKKQQRIYGTSRGIEVTDEVIAKLAAEAEAGYDIRKIRPRRGRPPMGTEAATVFQVRLDPELRRALDERASREGLTPSELARRLLRSQLCRSPKRPA